MQSKGNIHFRIFEYSFFNHEFCTTFHSGGRAFFCRLKYKFNSTLQVGFHSRQQLGNSHKNCNMRIVTTGMHNPYFLSIVLCPYL